MPRQAPTKSTTSADATITSAITFAMIDRPPVVVRCPTCAELVEVHVSGNLRDLGADLHEHQALSLEEALS